MVEENNESHEIIKESGLNSKTTTLDIRERTEGALCYVLWFISGLILIIIEKDSKFVRFHAIQSVAIFLPLYIFISEIEKVILTPTIGFSMNIFGLLIVATLLSVMWTLVAILWLLLIYKASKGEKYKLPIVGTIAEKYA